MNILLLGPGARAHALALRFVSENSKNRVWCLPGNLGIQHPRIVSCFTSTPQDAEGLPEWARQQGIDLTIALSEKTLFDGIGNAFRQNNLLFFGPTAEAAQIEKSKQYAKQIMRQLGIPSPAYAVFDQVEAADTYLGNTSFPVVIKADGPTQGKGVYIAKDYAEASTAVHALLVERSFGQNSSSIIVEEFVQGPEYTFVVFTDGKEVLLWPTVRDYKAIYDGDVGTNTGGMGAYAPVQIITRDMQNDLLTRVFQPILAFLTAQGHPYSGTLNANIIFTAHGPQVLEFNCHLGDPETQTLIPLFNGNLANLMQSVASNRLDPTLVGWHDLCSVWVTMTSPDYPSIPKSRFSLHPQYIPRSENYLCYNLIQNGTELQAMGGRILSVGGIGPTFSVAIKNVYNNIRFISEQIDTLYYRHDIAQETLA